MQAGSPMSIWLLISICGFNRWKMFGLSYLNSQAEVSGEKGKKEKILANCLLLRVYKNSIFRNCTENVRKTVIGYH